MTDYISREVLENWVREEVASLDSKEDREFVIQRWRKEIPAADVAPVVHAEWVPFGKRGIYGMIYACSSCHAKYDGKTNYCPNCGADMREE